MQSDTAKSGCSTTINTYGRFCSPQAPLNTIFRTGWKNTKMPMTKMGNNCFLWIQKKQLVNSVKRLHTFRTRMGFKYTHDLIQDPKQKSSYLGMSPNDQKAHLNNSIKLWPILETREWRQDSLTSSPTAKHNQRIRHDHQAAQGALPMTFDFVPKHFEEVPLFTNHHQLQYINNMAASRNLSPPFKHVKNLKQDNGERF